MGKGTNKPKYRCPHCGSYEVTEFTEEGIELTEEVREVIKKEDGVKIGYFKCSLCGYKWDKFLPEYSESGVGAAAMSGAPLFLGIISDILIGGIKEGAKALRRWKHKKRGRRFHGKYQGNSGRREGEQKKQDVKIRMEKQSTIENPHPMHQFLKRSAKNKISIREVDSRIIEYFTSDPKSGKIEKVLEELGGTGFFLLILVVNRQPQLILTKMGGSRTGFAPEVVGVIDDIPQDLLIKEIQRQGGDLDINRQYIVDRGKNNLVMEWIKSVINKAPLPNHTEMIDFNKKRAKPTVTPDWLKELPNHLKPGWEEVKKLEQLRAQFNIPHNLFGLRVLSSPLTTIKAQRYSYNRLKNIKPMATEKELLQTILEERLQTPPATKMSKREIDEAMKTINSFEDLCKFIIRLDKLELATPDPLEIGKRIDEILEEGLELYIKLLEAVTKGNSSAVESLIEEGANINVRNDYDDIGNTPLMIASLKGYVEIVKTLVEKGANINAKDNIDQTALMKASAEGHIEVVEHLLEKNADYKSSDKDGWSVLMAASSHVEIVKLLINKGADANAKNNFGETALMMASRQGHMEVVKLLIENGADVVAKDKIGDTALTYASFNGQAGVVRLLIENIADINARKEVGLGALLAASGRGYTEVVKVLIDKKIDINGRDENRGITALMMASRQGHMEVVKLLIENGADVNAKHNNGGTALMSASAEGHPEMVKLLINKGANVNVKNNFGETALMYASSRRNMKVVRLLKSAGAKG